MVTKRRIVGFWGSKIRVFLPLPSGEGRGEGEQRSTPRLVLTLGIIQKPGFEEKAGLRSSEHLWNPGDENCEWEWSAADRVRSSAACTAWRRHLISKSNWLPAVSHAMLRTRGKQAANCISIRLAATRATSRWQLRKP